MTKKQSFYYLFRNEEIVLNRDYLEERSFNEECTYDSMADILDDIHHSGCLTGVSSM